MKITEIRVNANRKLKIKKGKIKNEMLSGNYPFTLKRHGKLGKSVKTPRFARKIAIFC